jgi:predicted phosphodiesterase
MGIKSDTAREFRDRYGMEMPTLQLARIMYKETNPLFNNVEDARQILRYIEGKNGDAKIRKVVKDSKYFLEESRPKNPYKLPESDEIPYEPFILKGHKRLAILSDIHIPYHSMAAITAALDFCKKEKPDALLLNGDVLDCFQLSRFVKDPRKRHFAEELRIFKEMMDIFKREFNCNIYFKYGNHEERYEHFLFTKAKELVGVDEFELENIIKARANGIEIIKDKRIIHASGLNIIHGHEFSTAFFSPVNVARGLFLRGKTSALQGHSHQTSSHTESDMNGKITTTWSSGCLSELHPNFAPINKWNWGFAIVDIDGKSFNVRNKTIYKGEVF